MEGSLLQINLPVFKRLKERATLADLDASTRSEVQRREERAGLHDLDQQQC